MRSEVVKFKTLDGVTTWDSVTDWDMRLTHCDEQKPAPKFERVDIPGANGSIDLSTALSNDIPFEDREVDLTFFKLCDDHDDAFDLANTVANAIHGKQLHIQTPDSYTDGNTWYTGDVEITACVFEDRGCEISVHAVCDPFRYSATDGTLQLTPAGAPTAMTAAQILEVANNEFDTPALQFDFNNHVSSGWANVPALGVACACTDNLFDIDLVNLRGKTVKTNESWQKSNNIAQSGQTIDFGAVNYQWQERAVLTATNATADIYNVRIPFCNGSHLYIIVQSDPITAKGSVTVDGSTIAAGVHVSRVNAIAGSIGADGITSAGNYAQIGTLSAPSVGQSIDAVIDCGTLSYSAGQIYIDVTGITSANVTAQVVLVDDGLSVTEFIDPDISVEIVQLPFPLTRKKVSGVWKHDEYTSTPPHAEIDQLTTGAVIEAPSFIDWPRDTKWCEFEAVDSSGWIMQYPEYNAQVSIWPMGSGTADTGAQPCYPAVVNTSGSGGSVVSYNGNEFIVYDDAELSALLSRGSNAVTWATFNTSSVSPELTWPIGAL